MGILVIIILVFSILFIIVKNKESSKTPEVESVVIDSSEEKIEERSTEINLALVRLIDAVVNKIGPNHADGLMIHISNGFQKIDFYGIAYSESFRALIAEGGISELTSYDDVRKYYFSNITEEEARLIRSMGGMEDGSWVIMKTMQLNEETMKEIVKIVDNHCKDVKIDKYQCDNTKVFVRCESAKFSIK